MKAQPAIYEDATAYLLRSSLEEQLLATTIEKERQLKDMLMIIKIEEYVEFKSICDNLAAIKKSSLILTKYFSLLVV